MTDTTIQIDAKTKAIRSDDRWVIQRMQSDGNYDMVDNWTGNRRSLFHWLEKNRITPSRDAEQQLALLPERKSFREDTE